MPFLNMNDIGPFGRFPGWFGRTWVSENMTFARWDFKAGTRAHEHHHPNEEV